jgi:hypothetical protein
MTIENDFIVWAAGGGNVASQATYAAAAQLANGYVAGVAPSGLFNKTFRQGTIMAAMLADFIVQQAGLPAVDDGTTATLLASFIAALGATSRVKLLASGNVYVNGGTGNDVTGNGTLSLPWATIQHAALAVQTGYDLAGHTMTINVAAGTYTAGAALTGPIVGANGPGSLIVQGAGSGSTTVSVSAANCFSAALGAAFTVNGFTLTATGSVATGFCIVSQSNAAITLGTDIVFSTAGNAHISADINGLVTGSTYGITGGAGSHWNEGKGLITMNPGTVTLTGTPTFTGAFAIGALGGLMEVTATSFVGSATCPRYSVTLNSVIYTNGAGGTYFPGSAGGTTGTGGQYS